MPKVSVGPYRRDYQLEIRLERERQDQKWGVQTHNRGTGPQYAPHADHFRKVTDTKARSGTDTWADILLEEVYEALAESDTDALRKELIQAAAVCVAFAEALDDGRG